MTNLRFTWDPFNHIGTVANDKYPQGVQFTGEDKKPDLSFDFDGMEYVSNDTINVGTYTNLTGDTIPLLVDQVSELRSFTQSFSIDDASIDVVPDAELEREVVFLATEELKKTEFLTEPNLLATLPEKAELLAFRAYLAKVITNPAKKSSSFSVAPEITALYSTYNIEYSYLVKLGVTMDQINASITSSISEYVTNAENEKDIEIAAIVTAAKYNAEKVEQDAQDDADAVRKSADDYATSVYTSVDDQNREDARRLVVNRLMTQAGVTMSSLSKSDGSVIAEYILKDMFTLPGLTGVYGAVPDGNDVFDCLGLDKSQNEFSDVMNQHMEQKTIWDVRTGAFERLNPVVTP